MNILKRRILYGAFALAGLCAPAFPAEAKTNEHCECTGSMDAEGSADAEGADREDELRATDGDAGDASADDGTEPHVTDGDADLDGNVADGSADDVSKLYVSDGDASADESADDGTNLHIANEDAADDLTDDAAELRVVDEEGSDDSKVESEDGTLLKLMGNTADEGLTRSAHEEDSSVDSDQGILHPGTSPFGSGNRIWFLNVSGGSFNSDMILVESDGHFGLIDAGNRYDDHILDQDGTEYYVPWVYEDGTYAYLSCQAEGRNGRDAAIYIVETLGVTHLDFIITSHSHSDHIGGIPEIAALLVEDETGVHGLIDERTIYLKKQFHHISALQDDLGEETREDSWHSQAFEYQAERSVEECGGVVLDVSKGLTTSDESQPELDYSDVLDAINASSVVDPVDSDDVPDTNENNTNENNTNENNTSENNTNENHADNAKAQYDQGDPDNWFDDSLEFLFGNLLIRLYNLFDVQGARDDNVNSLAVVISDGFHQLFTAGDLNVDYGVQQKVAEAVYEDCGTMDVIKASDHGSAHAFSKEHLDLLQPEIVITPASRTKPTNVLPTGSYSAGLYYAGENYGTISYEVGASDRAIVVELLDDGVAARQLTGEAEQAQLVSADGCITNILKRSGWVEWTEACLTKNGSNEVNYYYFVDNQPVTGWWDIDEARYYFDEDGFMYRGWLTKDGKTYFLQASGIMRTGWMRQGESVYYFDPEDGASVTGWIESSGKTYYLLDSQKWLTGFHMIDGEGYYFRDNGVMHTGWMKTEDGYRYFDEEGHMQSEWLVLDGHTYYLPNGIMVTGWQELPDGEVYYFDPNGVMVTGWQTLYGSVYFFDAEGRMQTG